MSLILLLNAWLKLGLRRLLQVDRPVPPRSDEEITAEVERNYRWNYSVNLIEGATFFFGASFASSSTIIPLFISKLSSSPLPIGLASVIAQGGWFLPQLFTANLVERLPRKKPVVVNLGFFLERLPVWVLTAIALLTVRLPGLALALFLVCYAWYYLGAGLVATSWQDMVARCFPVDRRGRFWGITTFLGTGTGMLGALFSTRILGGFEFPINFAYLFLIAAISTTISWFFLALTREPVQPVTAPRQSTREFWASLLDILRNDHNFRRFLVARLTMAMGYMGFGFVTVAAVRRWHVSDSTVGIYTALLLFGQAFGNLVLGFLSDRFGHKLSLELSAAASGLAFALAWLAPTAEWYYAVFILLGVNLGAILVSGILVVMEFCEPQRRPTYTGLANTSVGLVGVLVPLLGAWLASFSYNWLFALSASINLAALAMLRCWVQEPRQARSAAVPVATSEGS